MRNILVLLTIILLSTSAGLFAQDAENVELVGMYERQISGFDDVNIQDGYAYMAMHSNVNDLFIFDLSEPDYPRFAGSHRDSLFDYLDVSVSGDYAYSGKYRPFEGDNEIYELQVLDVSNPENPTPLGSCILDTCNASNLDVFVSGNYVYVKYNTHQPDEGTLKIVDISNPENPEVVWASIEDREIYDIFISEEIAYVTYIDVENRGDHLLILDVSDAANPESLTVLDLEGSAFNVIVDGDLAFVCYLGSVSIIDISEPQNPEIIGVAETEDNICGWYSLCAVDDILFLAGGASGSLIQQPDTDGEWGGIAAFDISDPTEPRELDAIELDYGVSSINVADGFAYAGDGSYCLNVFDVSNPNDITWLNACHSRRPSGVCVSGDYAYVAAGNAGLVILDITDSENPVETGYILLDQERQGGNHFRHVTIEGDLVYLSCYEHSQINCVDVSDPQRPQIVGRYDTDCYIEKYIQASNGYVYYADEDRLKIIDFSNPGDPVEVGEFQTEHHISNLFIAGGYAYVLDQLDLLEVLDISDPENIRLSGTCEIGWYLTDVFVTGDYAFITSNRVGRLHGDEGLYIADISNPENIRQIGFVPMFSGVDEVIISGDYAYLIRDDEWQIRLEGELYVFDVSDRSDPVEVGFYVTPGSAKDVFFTEDIIYVADESNFGIYRFQLEGPFLSTSPISLDFGIVTINRSVEKTLTIRNLGVDDLLVTNISTQNDNFRSDFTSEIVLEPNAREEVTVTLETDEDGVSEGVLIIDSSDPRENIGRVSLTGAGIRGYYIDTPGWAEDVFVSGGYAYIADSHEGLRIIDLSIPESLEEIGFCDPSGLPEAVFVAGDFAYLAPCGEVWGLSIINISDPENPEAVGFYDMNESWYRAKDIVVSGRYAFIAGSNPEGIFSDWLTCMFVIDISDPSNPVRRGSFGPLDSDSEDVSLSVSGNICFMSQRGEIIYVVDVSNPNSPRLQHLRPRRERRR